MHIVFFDVQGLLIDHAVSTGTTVNGDYYASFIRHHLRPAIRKKRPDLLLEGPIILHNNASPHTERDVVQLLIEEVSMIGRCSNTHRTRQICHRVTSGFRE